jgi:hypothetical protein
MPLSLPLSNSYGIIGREIEVEATIRGLDNSDGLDLQFWAETPSGKYEELGEIKTKKLSRGEEASYTTLYMQVSSITTEGLVDILIPSGLKSSVVPAVYATMIVVMKAKLL